VVGRLLALFVLAALSGVSGLAAQEAPVDTLAAPVPVMAPAESLSAAPTPADSTPAGATRPDTAAPAAPSGLDEVEIYGLVTDANGLPMAGINVNLFVAGLEEKSAVTDTSGTFSMTHPIDPAADETVVLWFTPPRGMGLVREIVVLKESEASAMRGHYGPCVTKAILSPSTFLEVQILDQAGYATKIEESECMEMAGGMGDAVFEFRYNLPAGQTFTVTSATTEQSKPEGEDVEPTTTEGKVSYLVTVESSTEEGLALNLEYTERSAGNVDFSPLIGQTATLLLSPTGELSRFAGFDALPEISAGPMSLSSQAYINELRVLLPALPVGEVGQGDSWTDEIRFQEPIPGGTANVTVDVTYTLRGQTMFKGADCLEIGSEYTFAFAGQGETQGTPFTLSVDGTGTEEIYFAHERGMMLEKTGQRTSTSKFESRGMSFLTEDETRTTVTVTLQ
jgi:hypothetical protein